MFSIPQVVLSQILTIKNTTPERLSQHEMSIAQRICHCTMCNNLWVRHPEAIPNRCPHCHKRNWDRPLITALLMGHPPVLLPRPTPRAQLTSPPQNQLPPKTESEAKL